MPINETPQYNKQHAVPQNIMDVEFKIIGELTLRQFAYVLVFGAIAYIVAVYMQGIFKWPIAITSALLGFGLAFVPIEERGMDVWIVNFITAIYTPNQKIWKKEAETPSVFLYQNMAVVKQELITLAPTTSRRKLEEFLYQQEANRKEDRLDIPEQRYIEMARESFAKVSVHTDTVVSAPDVVEESVGTISPGPSKPPASESSKEEEAVEIKEEQKQTLVPERSEVKPDSPDTSVQPNTPDKSDIPVQPSVSIQPQTDHQPEPKPQPESSPQSEIKTQFEHKPQLEQKPQPATASFQQSFVRPGITKPQILSRIKPQVKRKEDVHTLNLPGKRDYDYNLIASESHAGRRFVSLLPKEGEIILPIRGEKVIKTSEERSIEESIQNKTEQLNKLVEQIKKSKQYKDKFENREKESKQAQQEQKPQHPAQPQQQSQTPDQPQPTRAQLDEQTKRLMEEAKKLKEEIEKTKAMKEQVKPFPVSPVQDNREEEKPIGTIQYAKMNPIANKPNTLSGVVKNQEGAGIRDIVIIIKNERHEAVRALKTNTLGQFKLVTPLLNGRYSMEIDPSHKSGLVFDIIFVEAKGEIIPPLEFIGKK